MVALSFTTILIQVQAAYQGNARDLLPILIAALLAMAAAARSLRARTGLTRINPEDARLGRDAEKAGISYLVTYVPLAGRVITSPRSRKTSTARRIVPSATLYS